MRNGKKPHLDSLVGISIKKVREVFIAVFYEAEVLNSEGDILPFLCSRPAIRCLQGKVLNGYIWQQGTLLVLHLESPVL